MKVLLLAVFTVMTLATSFAPGATTRLHRDPSGSAAVSPALPEMDAAPANTAGEPLPVPPNAPAAVSTSQLLLAVAIAILFLWQLEAAHRPAERKRTMHW